MNHRDPVWNEYGEHEIEDRIARLTWAGVVASALVVVIGVVMQLVRAAPLAVPHAPGGISHSLGRVLGDVLRGVMRGEPPAIIQAGIILLIGTPWMRVALTLFLYLRQRDWVYTVICLILLAVMIAGLVIGAA